jgi:hypothetical protein
MNERQIIEKLGRPTSRFNGHYGLAPKSWADAHPNCETLTYQKPNGTLYVTVEPKGGERVGLCSQWLPAGGAF